MKTSKWMKRFAVIAGSALMGLTLASGANAANPEPVVAEVTFVAAVTITEQNALQYGLLDEALANLETVVIDPDGTVTDAGSNVVGGTQAAADMEVTATTGQAITITIGSITSNTGYTLGSFMCNYNAAGVDSACDGGGYSETSVATGELLIGATLTGDGTAGPGTFNGSFNVTVAYQ
jgi:hypothetical protein